MYRYRIVYLQENFWKYLKKLIQYWYYDDVWSMFMCFTRILHEREMKVEGNDSEMIFFLRFQFDFVIGSLRKV